MTTVYDVPPDMLLKKLADKLKQSAHIKMPEKLRFIKTGVHCEKAPSQLDWWYIRASAVLRKIYIHHSIGVARLAALFGGSRDRGSKPDRARKGSRAIIRHVLKQLEQAGYVISVKGTGRQLSPTGRAFLDNTAHELMQELSKHKPELAKY
ncbi:MAG: 30S ribosomal protein S19e [Candidatus Thermoplasmatota archaeon]|nr:30S ribosomal protein S19e [Candidatus Thermoplasmatota archaeon]